MTQNISRILLIMSIIFLSTTAWAQDLDLDNIEMPDIFDPSAGQESQISAKASIAKSAVRPGSNVPVKLEVTIHDGWVWYDKNPGPYSQAGKITVEADGFKIARVDWPKPQEYKTEGLDFTNYVHKGTVVLTVHLSVDTKAKQGPRQIKLNIGQQICSSDGSCVSLEGNSAVSTSLEITVKGEPTKPESPPATIADPKAKPEDSDAKSKNQSNTKTNTSDSHSLLGWFGMALLAGLLMNFTPCVLPIIPLRIYGIVQMADDSRRRFVTLGLAFAAGIVLFFALVALLNIGLHFSLARGFKWSEQWQYPFVRIGMVLILVTVAANMFGLFNITVPKKISAIEAKSTVKKGQGHLSSLGMGLMMAVLSTPCTVGPIIFVLAWAQGEGIVVATTTFLLLGIGMAAPHAVLAAFPDLTKLLPKPGVWMEWFKQTMGFAILGVGAYMLSSFSDDGYVGWVAVCGVLLAFCLWVWGTWVRFDATLKRKLVIRGSVVVLGVVASYFILQPPPKTTVSWEPYTDGIVESSQSEGKVVIVKFTATWCTVCKVVDKNIFANKDVGRRINRGNYIAIKADTTDADMPASLLLNKHFPNYRIPLTVIYSPNKNIDPIALPGIYSPEDFFQALDAAGGK